MVYVVSFVGSARCSALLFYAETVSINPAILRQALTRSFGEPPAYGRPPTEKKDDRTRSASGKKVQKKKALRGLSFLFCWHFEKALAAVQAISIFATRDRRQIVYIRVISFCTIKIVPIVNPTVNLLFFKKAFL